GHARGGIVIVEGDKRQAAAAPMIDQAIVRDRIKPGREPRARLVARARLDYAHPDLLVELLGERAHLDAAQDETEKARSMPAVERLEGPGIPAAIGKHELLIRRLGHSRRV